MTPPGTVNFLRGTCFQTRGVFLDVTEVEGMGWLSIIVDPTGAVLGLWEPSDM